MSHWIWKKLGEMERWGGSSASIRSKGSKVTPQGLSQLPVQCFPVLPFGNILPVCSVISLLTLGKLHLYYFRTVRTKLLSGHSSSNTQGGRLSCFAWDPGASGDLRLPVLKLGMPGTNWSKLVSLPNHQFRLLSSGPTSHTDVLNSSVRARNKMS